MKFKLSKPKLSNNGQQIIPAEFSMGHDGYNITKVVDKYYKTQYENNFY